MGLQDLQARLRKMERVGEVDTSVVEEIDGLKRNIQTENIHIFDELDRLESYKAYFLIKTQLDILEQMKSRIEKSKDNDDNPKVVEDSIEVIDSLQKYSRLTPSKIKESNFADFLKLQKKAKKLDLFPGVEKIKKGIKKPNVETANRFFDNIRNEIQA